MWTDPLGRKPGEALDPTRHTEQDLQIRMAANPRTASAVWQQSPRQATGNLINIEHFNKIHRGEVPVDRLMWVRAWDLAFSEKEVTGQNPDFTSSCLMGLLEGDDDNYAFYIYNITRWRRSWSDTKIKIKDIGLIDGVHTPIVVEGGGAQKGLGDTMKGEKMFAPFTINVIPPMADKVARAQYWVDKLDIGKMYLVIDDFNKPFLNECDRFPFGTHDDQVDAVSLAFFYLMEYLKAPSVTVVKAKGLYGKRK